jgi:hypothetical protein
MPERLPGFIQGVGIRDDVCCLTPDLNLPGPEPFPTCGQPVAYWMRSGINGLVFPSCADHTAWARAERPEWIEAISSSPLEPRKLVYADDDL